MAKYRPQRGTIEESMAEVTEVTNLRALANHLGVDDLTKIRTEFYMWDKRIEWYTYIVVVDGKAVGFTNGQL